MRSGEGECQEWGGGVRRGSEERGVKSGEGGAGSGEREWRVGTHKHTQHCAWCQSQLVNFTS